MKVTIQNKPAFRVAGIDAKDIDTAMCANVWSRLLARYSPQKLSAFRYGQAYGVCHDVADMNKIDYMAGYDVRDTGRTKAMGLAVLEVPAAEYAVVELKGRIPDCIHEGWKYVMEVFFPEHGYRHSGSPDFEVYEEGDMDSPDYRMELWVPVTKE